MQLQNHRKIFGFNSILYSSAASFIYLSSKNENTQADDLKE
jgi:hypothetical protein